MSIKLFNTRIIKKGNTIYILNKVKIGYRLFTLVNEGYQETKDFKTFKEANKYLKSL